jgi:3-deoxy-D-manno-octulosonic-acid transferase
MQGASAPEGNPNTRTMLILFYSLLLALALLLSSPWWLFRMFTTSRYREGLTQRLGRVPVHLRDAQNKRTLWLHAVSVGEVLAASRLIPELESALGENYRIVISTTTRTGQALAHQRFGAGRVFYMPLDFAFAIRPYLNALQPAALILMESELWPRMLHECARRNIPVAVVNARISDRSFARAMRVRFLWKHILRKPTLWLAQSEQDATRLQTLIDLPQTPVILSEAQSAQPKDPETAPPAKAISTSNLGPTILTTGNLKYDIRAPKQSRIAELIHKAAAGRPIIVAGSTVEGEEEIIIAAFHNIWGAIKTPILIIAPRHPERFKEVQELADSFGAVTATQLIEGDAPTILRQTITTNESGTTYESNTLVIVLNTIGDLASVYGIANIAFVGGSLVNRGGHNPLEPVQFGVPVVMGPSFQNFRDVVSKLREADAIAITGKEEDLYTPPKSDPNENIGNLQGDEGAQGQRLRRLFEEKIIRLLQNPAEARALGERGRVVFESQQGATARTVAALLTMIGAAQ